jgi:hypothetical protein
MQSDKVDLPFPQRHLPLIHIRKGWIGYWGADRYWKICHTFLSYMVAQVFRY